MFTKSSGKTNSLCPNRSKGPPIPHGRSKEVFAWREARQSGRQVGVYLPESPCTLARRREKKNQTPQRKRKRKGEATRGERSRLTLAKPAQPPPPSATSRQATHTHSLSSSSSSPLLHLSSPRAARKPRGSKGGFEISAEPPRHHHPPPPPPLPPILRLHLLPTS